MQTLTPAHGRPVQPAPGPASPFPSFEDAQRGYSVPAASLVTRRRSAIHIALLCALLAVILAAIALLCAAKPFVGYIAAAAIVMGSLVAGLAMKHLKAGRH